MIKSKICKGDKVRIVQGEGRNAKDEQGAPLVCTVLQVDRIKGRAVLEVPKKRAKRGEKEKPTRGLEHWKTVRYNPKSGEAGGLKIMKRPIALANLELVEAGPREWRNRG
ncbi:MAG: hypothetical protein AMXMBFR7_21450 [Planctomycetota bacterium]|nr:hypothetical protein [Planctomycetota bacterium]